MFGRPLSGLLAHNIDCLLALHPRHRSHMPQCVRQWLRVAELRATVEEYERHPDMLAHLALCLHTVHIAYGRLCVAPGAHTVTEDDVMQYAGAWHTDGFA